MIHRSLIFGLLASTPLVADELSLKGDARLSGTVRSIDRNGAVELVTPLSPDPLFLKGESVSKVAFSPPGIHADAGAARVELINGDLIAGNLLSLDAHNLILETPVAGKLEIRRDVLKSLQLGVGENRLVYSGIHSLQGWEEEDGAGVWETEGKTLTMNATGSISRKMELPPRFVMRFQLQWETQPSFQLSLADPLLPAGKEADFYTFQVTATGIELRRHTGNGRPPVTLGFINRSFPSSRKILEVELRVNRVDGMFQLYLDGEPEGRFVDVVAPVPIGQGVRVGFIGQDDQTQQLRQFEILEWFPSYDRYRTRERGDKSRDALVSSEGERWSGELLPLNLQFGKVRFGFRSASQEPPFEIPEEYVSTIFFAEKSSMDKDAKTNPFVLRMHGNGFLRVASCTFDDTNAKVIHPLLGTLVILRSRIASLEWLGREGGPP